MPTRHVYRTIRTGVEVMPARLILPRHRHREGYANVVLGGAFVEASFAGRFTVGPGDVLLHGAFDCHANAAFGTRGPRILRLPWFDDDREGVFRVADPDRLVRVAERDPLAATAELAGMLVPSPAEPAAEGHWTAALRADPSLSLRHWSDVRRLAPATVSRGFARAFGTTARQFRLEVRTRRAWRRIVGSRTPLTTIAYAVGFADSAHMSRCVRLFTGHAPSVWRSAGQLRSSDLPPTLLAHVQAIRPDHAFHHPTHFLAAGGGPRRERRVDATDPSPVTHPLG